MKVMSCQIEKLLVLLVLGKLQFLWLFNAPHHLTSLPSLLEHFLEFVALEERKTTLSLHRKTIAKLDNGYPVRSIRKETVTVPLLGLFSNPP